MSDKFDITKHKNYRLLEDFDKKNLFDIEKYLQRKGKVRLNGNMIINIIKWVNSFEFPFIIKYAQIIIKYAQKLAELILPISYNNEKEGGNNVI